MLVIRNVVVIRNSGGGKRNVVGVTITSRAVVRSFEEG